MRRGAGAWLGLALVIAGCARDVPATLPAAPLPADGSISIKAAPVAQAEEGHEAPCLDSYPKHRRKPAYACDRWRYAGGLHLTSQDTSRLHGLSDLEVTTDGRLTAVTDVGDLLHARVLYDNTGRLAGLADARLTPLVGLEGEPIAGKRTADAEGLATLANGDRLTSFEVDHRIWLYPAGGGRPRPVPSPTGGLAENGGMEALSADPARGPDAYLVGIEETGRTWLCRIASGCRPGPTVAMPDLFGLVAARRLSGGRTAWLLRAYDPFRGNRIELRITDAGMRRLDSLEISRPASVDNFEGLASVPLKAGRYRFYLISDDNFAATQRTLLMAFDWTPPKSRSGAQVE